MNVRRLLAVALAGYVLVSLFNWYFHVTTYGVISLDDDRDAVHYALGSPTRISGSGRIWIYRLEANATLTAQFDANRRLETVSCRSSTAEPDSCPALYGIGIGETEDSLIARLGNASHVRIVGNRKFLTYADLGATYVLQQFIVTGLVRDADGGGFLGKTWKFFRSLVYLPGGFG